MPLPLTKVELANEAHDIFSNYYDMELNRDEEEIFSDTSGTKITDENVEIVTKVYYCNPEVR